MARIFLSYGRGDDVEPFDPQTSFLAGLHRDLTAAGFEVWFDRVLMPSRRLTFHQEIRDAVAAADRVVLVVGPHAVESEYVRQEWRFALEADKVVTPILRRGDYSLVPGELAGVHCEDFRDNTQYAFHLTNLIRQLNEPIPPLGRLHDVPPPPTHFLPRPARLGPLIASLRADLDRPVVLSGATTRVGVHGMGGIGKSVLAAAVARDRSIREAFPDGIVWLSFGQNANVPNLQRQAHQALGGGAAFADDEGRNRLSELLQDRAVLLILDDVWNRFDVSGFEVLGPRCRALITTRDAGMLQSLGGPQHVVDLLTDQEAVNLLAHSAGVLPHALPDEASAILSECGRLPLALALCGSLLRRGLSPATIVQQFQQARIDRIADRHAIESQHQSVWHAIHVSVAALPDSERERFLELVVFPEDAATPVETVETLWSQTGQIDDWATQELLTTLAERSLLTRTTSGDRARIEVHDLVHDYLRCITPDPRSLHGALLDGYQKRCPSGWSSGPEDGYFFTNLRHHLIAAGRGPELASLVQDWRWLARKASDWPFDIPADLRTARADLPEASPERHRLDLLTEAYVRDVHFIARHPETLFQSLYNACWFHGPAFDRYYESLSDGLHDVGLAALVEGWREAGATANRAWLRFLRPVGHLGMGQRGVFAGHQGQVQRLAFSPDGSLLASAARDGTARLWDAEKGQLLCLLSGHGDHVTNVAFSPDGRILASGSWDGTIRFWDSRDGSLLDQPIPIGSQVQGLAFLPDGRLVVGSGDRLVRILDRTNSGHMLTLTGHTNEVRAVAASADGRYVASVGKDHTARVWDAQTGEPLWCLRGHTRGLWSVALSPDGNLLVTGAADGDGGIIGWSLPEDGRIVFREVLDQRAIMDLAFTADGEQFAGVTYGAVEERNHTVRLWHRDGREARRYTAPEWGTALAIRADGERIATGDWVGHIRIWDTRIEPEARSLRGVRAPISCLAFTPEGLLVGGALDRSVRVWDGTTGTEVCQPFVGHSDAITAVVPSPLGGTVASASRDGTIRLWDLAGGPPTTLASLGQVVRCLAFSPDGAWIVAGSDDQTVRIWDSRSGQTHWSISIPTGTVAQVAIAHQGRLLAAGFTDGIVRIWRLDREASEERVLRGHRNTVKGLYCSPTGERLASAALDGKMRVWDMRSGNCLRILDGLGDVVALASGTPGYPWLALARPDDETVVRDGDGQPIARLPTGLSQLVTHPDGQTWAGLKAGTLYLFRLERSGG